MFQDLSESPLEHLDKESSTVRFWFMELRTQGRFKIKRMILVSRPPPPVNVVTNKALTIPFSQSTSSLKKKLANDKINTLSSFVNGVFNNLGTKE